MKIIEDNSKKEIQIKCPHCNSILEYTKDDINREITLKGLYSNPVGVFIEFLNCPCCQNIIELENDR